MLVKVKNKATGNEQCITQRAYNFSKKRYVFLGNCEEGEDLDSYTSAKQVVSQESPNQATTAPIASQAPVEDGKVAQVVDGKPEQPAAVKVKAKPGPKSKKQISSDATGTEV